ncbi:unnamed protein product, partial [Pylaiella littoralis]
RSPRLATLSGCTGITISSVAIVRKILGFWPEDGAWDLYGTLMALLLYTAAYDFRGIRLLVMYNPHSRQRWGRFIKDALMTKILLVSFVVLSMLVSILCLFYGIKRRGASQYLLAYVADVILRSISISMLEFAKLRKTNDMFQMSPEVRLFIVFDLLSLAAYIAFSWRYVMVAFMMTRFQPAVWLTNIQPVRAALQREAGGKHNEGNLLASFFPWQPWRKGKTSKVAIGRQDKTHPPTCGGSGTCCVITTIMQSPPHLEAFEDFCRKALCSELLMFLGEVGDFSSCLHAVFTPSRAFDSKEDAEFATFCVLVGKYIKDGSPFEVNIESKTKIALLRITDRDTFNK